MLILADALRIPLRDRCVQCVVTSPPYWALRDYGVIGQIGREETPSAYVGAMVRVFEEVRRVLADDGVLWLNIGDTYCNGDKWASDGLKRKDLVGIPWVVAFALRSAGWFLRADVIWSKPNPMPESVKDRPTRSHEYLFLLSKSDQYYYNRDAIKNAAAASTLREIQEGYAGHAIKGYDGTGAQNASSVKTRIIAGKREKQSGHGRRHSGFNDRWDQMSKADQVARGSNARSVWTIAPKPFGGAHFATMPEKLVERCVLAASRPGDVVFDPFGGTGTTVRVARRFNRRGVMLELNTGYMQLAAGRITGVQTDIFEVPDLSNGIRL